MQDVEMTMDDSESMSIDFYQGKEIGNIFLWAKSEHEFSISINIDGDEKFVVSINHACSEIKIEKDNR